MTGRDDPSEGANPNEAEKELHRIPESSRGYPSILKIEVQIAAIRNEWDSVLLKSTEYCRTCPEEDFGWTWRTESLHKLQRTRDAQGLLLGVAAQFPKSLRVCFDLARYASILNKREEARTWLETAMALGDRRKILQDAVEDSAFESLWEELGGLSL